MDKGIFRYYSFINLIIRWRMFYIYLKLNQIEIFFCRKNSWQRISWYKFKVESNVSPFVYNYSVFSIPLYLRVIKKKVASKWLHIELNQNYFLPWSGLIHSYFLIAVKSRCIYLFFPFLNQRERDYYSKNLSILNISSYSDCNLYWDAKFSEHEKLWRYSNYKSSDL